MDWPFALRELLIGALTLAVSLAAAGHAVLHKRDVRAAAGWTALILFLPIAGTVAYLLLGVNRVARHGETLLAGRRRYRESLRHLRVGTEALAHALGDDAYLAGLSRFVGQRVAAPLLRGNRVEPYDGGDDAYDAMLAAIGDARSSVALATYIFGNDRTGRAFHDALAAAVARGVQVRVLIDGVGDHYSWPSIGRTLRAGGVPVAFFLRAYAPWRMRFFNLRNHRKLLIVDGTTAFTGGMNIRAGHRLADRPPHPVRDLHFRVEGPVVATLRQIFAEDWSFTTQEVLTGTAWFPPADTTPGPVLARAIADGPGGDFETVHGALLGALACARDRVRILTPYFLPEAGLTTALEMAARRGVAVDVILPARSNLLLVQWAMAATLWRPIAAGCRVWLTPPPFDHSKLVLVDDAWALFGSANWDARSLRLNFELDVECYDRALAGRLDTLVESRRAAARRLTLEEVDGRPLPIRLRDGVARLFAPYL